mmetsp:Transcript_4748/g.14353  ORF Transcript_4748/g.14353 Transcript_4748/m.14353 type:complete len:279 (+) Transcript_4748:1172-2008(+)
MSERGPPRPARDETRHDRAAAGGGRLQGEVQERGDHPQGERRARHGRRRRDQVPPHVGAAPGTDPGRRHRHAQAKTPPSLHPQGQRPPHGHGRHPQGGPPRLLQNLRPLRRTQGRRRSVKNHQTGRGQANQGRGHAHQGRPLRARRPLRQISVQNAHRTLRRPETSRRPALPRLIDLLHLLDRAPYAPPLRPSPRDVSRVGRSSEPQERTCSAAGAFPPSTSTRVDGNTDRTGQINRPTDASRHSARPSRGRIRRRTDRRKDRRLPDRSRAGRGASLH